MSASTTSLVGVLKKKMLDTKEEVEKVKEQIQDMTRIMEVVDQWEYWIIIMFYRNK